jgi:hypothetical protein
LPAAICAPDAFLAALDCITPPAIDAPAAITPAAITAIAMKIMLLGAFVKDKENAPRKFTDYFVDDIRISVMFHSMSAGIQSCRARQFNNHILWNCKEL